jgi:hypothetical protein
MKWRYVFGAILAPACIWALASAPIHAQTGKQNLFPIGEGSSWEFSGTAGKQPITMSAKVTSSKAGKDGHIVGMHWLMGANPVQDEEYIVTATSVSRAKSGKDASSTVTPPIPVIKYPMEVGKSWNWSGKIYVAQAKISLDGNATLKVAAKENVKTGAGTFQAYRVDMVLNILQGQQKMTVPNSYWFAPGVGLIKQSSEIAVPNGQKIVIEASVSKYTIK